MVQPTQEEWECGRDLEEAHIVPNSLPECYQTTLVLSSSQGFCGICCSQPI